MRYTVFTFALGLFINIASAQVDMSVIDAVPVKYLTPGIHHFSVAAKNTAATPTNSYRIYWQYDNGPTKSAIPQPAPPLGQAGPANVKCDSFIINVTQGTHYLKTWIECLNYTETYPTDDTVITKIKVLPYLPSKNVVLETYKHQLCTPCYPAATYIKHRTDTMQGYFLANVYTDPWDELYLAEGDTVNAVYFPAHPAPCFDRFLFPYATTLWRSYFYIVGYGDTLDDIGEREHYYEPVSVAFNHVEFDSVSRLLKAKIKATFYDTLIGDYRFNIFLTEDSVKAYQAGAPDEYNYYHMNVMRRMIGSAWGAYNSLPGVLYPGQSVYYDFQYTVPVDYKFKDLNLIGLVQKYSTDPFDRLILNSCKSSLPGALALSANELVNDHPVICYDPLRQNINITLGISTKSSHLSLIDMNGRTIRSYKLVTTNEEFNISELPAGAYIVNIDVGGKQYKSKLIKN